MFKVFNCLRVHFCILHWFSIRKYTGDPTLHSNKLKYRDHLVLQTWIVTSSSIDKILDKSTNKISWNMMVYVIHEICVNYILIVHKLLCIIISILKVTEFIWPKTTNTYLFVYLLIGFDKWWLLFVSLLWVKVTQVTKSLTNYY